MREIKEKEIGSILDSAELKILSEVIRKKKYFNTRSISTKI